MRPEELTPKILGNFIELTKDWHRTRRSLERSGSTEGIKHGRRGKREAHGSVRPRTLTGWEHVLGRAATSPTTAKRPPVGRSVAQGRAARITRPGEKQARHCMATATGFSEAPVACLAYAHAGSVNPSTRGPSIQSGAKPAAQWARSLSSPDVVVLPSWFWKAFFVPSVALRLSKGKKKHFRLILSGERCHPREN